MKGEKWLDFILFGWDRMQKGRLGENSVCFLVSRRREISMPHEVDQPLVEASAQVEEVQRRGSEPVPWLPRSLDLGDLGSWWPSR